MKKALLTLAIVLMSSGAWAQVLGQPGSSGSSGVPSTYRSDAERNCQGIADPGDRARCLSNLRAGSSIQQLNGSQSGMDRNSSGLGNSPSSIGSNPGFGIPGGTSGVGYSGGGSGGR